MKLTCKSKSVVNGGNDGLFRSCGEVRYTASMTKLSLIALAAILGTAPAPSLSQATDFTLVNETGMALGAMSIRRTGSSDWRAMGSAPAPGASQSMPFADEDCAFDIRAETPSGPIEWDGVNLCEVSAVSLRVVAGTPFVDYR